MPCVPCSGKSPSSFGQLIRGSAHTDKLSGNVKDSMSLLRVKTHATRMAFRSIAIREAGHRDEIIEGVDNKRAHEKNGQFESVEAARMEKGDLWSGFRYTL